MSTIVRQLPGLSDYAQTLDAMREFTRSRTAESNDELWLLQHPPVFTLGLAARLEHLLEPGPIPVVKTERGGQVTYHGPGQLVAYTLIDLRRKGLGVKELVFRIEQSLIQTLEAFRIDARRVAGAPGVYVPLAGGHGSFAGLAKIAALGIKISGGCSYHGAALNVAMDLAPFSRIDACGYQGLRSIDMASLGIKANVSELADTLSERLLAHLG
ncbi:MAG: lipoyl(octanoyl) transferase LipB [Quisquiliibacterium sp.]